MSQRLVCFDGGVDLFELQRLVCGICVVDLIDSNIAAVTVIGLEVCCGLDWLTVVWIEGFS